MKEFHPQSEKFDLLVVQKLKQVKESLKFEEFILWGLSISAANVTLIHSVLVKIFHSEQQMSNSWWH